MKKQILKTMLLGCGVLTLTACSDFLEQKSLSRNDASDVFENPAPIALAINGLYADLCGEAYTQLMTIHQGSGTDVELIDGIGATATAASERGAMNYNATAGGWAKLETLWEEQYNTILDCNRIIDGIRNSTIFTEGSESDKIAVGKYLSEALTIRAMVYLDLVRVFGDIPMMLHDSKSDLSNVNVGKTDRDVILDQMIDDLEWVVTAGYLPWAGQVTTEHINMGYAEALLANIYMTRAGYAIREAGDEAAGQPYSVDAKLAAGYVKGDYSDDVYQTLRPSDADCKNYYEKAKEHLENVMASGKHDMNQSFVDLWYNVNQLKLDPSHENMFEIAMGFGNSGELGYTVGVRLNDKNKGKYQITDYGYTNSSGKLKTTAVQLYSYAAHDQRRDITCVNYEIVDIDRSSTTTNEKWTTAETFLSNKPFGLYIGKWDVRKMSDQWKEQNRTANGKFGYGINVIRMRYPQVLLWYAECLNELNGGPTDEAKDCVKKVHERAYYGDGNNPELTFFNNFIDNITDKDEFLNAICEENKLEFCGEGFRKWDLIRWNKLHEAIWMAKVNYYQWRRNAFFPEKIYWKYTDDTEKEVDDASITWYGQSGTWNGIFGISTASKVTEVDNDWLEAHGYRSPKGVVHPALGIGSKGLNACSYNKGAFGQEPSSLSVDLPSICGGLVGTQMLTASDIDINSCKDVGVDVKNRYLMPLHSNVVNASIGRLKNSYGYSN